MKTYVELHFQATDNGSPPRSSTVDVSVYVLDENDNVPQFEGSPYTVEIKENGPAGEEVHLDRIVLFVLI